MWEARCLSRGSRWGMRAGNACGQSTFFTFGFRIVDWCDQLLEAPAALTFSCAGGRLELWARTNPFSLKLLLPEYFVTATGKGTKAASTPTSSTDTLVLPSVSFPGLSLSPRTFPCCISLRGEQLGNCFLMGCSCSWENDTKTFIRKRISVSNEKDKKKYGPGSY